MVRLTLPLLDFLDSRKKSNQVSFTVLIVQLHLFVLKKKSTKINTFVAKHGRKRWIQIPLVQNIAEIDGFKFKAQKKRKKEKGRKAGV